jgi:DNA-binding IclR family transcriptional regulator
LSEKLKKQMLAHLSVQPMSLKELAEKMELKEKRAFTLLRSLFQGEQIISIRCEDGQRRYKTTEKPQTKEPKEEDILPSI